jgi:proline dehydrogenase
LEKISAGKSLSTQDEHEFESLRKRLDVICNKAHEVKVSIYIDAEESWIQEAIDQLVNIMMKRYNKTLPIVYNTFQLYRHNRLDNLKQSHRMAKEHGYILGAKLVRGAYLDKERKRAEMMTYRSPIHVDKYSTDRSYNDALLYCLENVEEIAVVNASHNAESNYLMAQKITEYGIRLDHPHIHFSQLYGMSDNITFNLAHAGHSVSKYVPYGQIEDVIPYLIRRTQENTSVTGDLSRELKYIISEIKRRKLEEKK